VFYTIKGAERYTAAVEDPVTKYDSQDRRHGGRPMMPAIDQPRACAESMAAHDTLDVPSRVRIARAVTERYLPRQHLRTPLDRCWRRYSRCLCRPAVYGEVRGLSIGLAIDLGVLDSQLTPAAMTRMRYILGEWCRSGDPAPRVTPTILAVIVDSADVPDFLRVVIRGIRPTDLIPAPEIAQDPRGDAAGA
jgi:hypothetical protein